MPLDMNQKSALLMVEVVLYIPSLQRNLISIEALADTRNVLLFSDIFVWVFNNIRDQKVIVIGHRDKSNGLYRMDMEGLDANSVTTSSVVELWHRRYSHLHFRGLSHLSKQKRVIGLSNLREH
jgi:hypothetical protein